nr:hypothetical protein [Tanacetum cinerariifolium]
GELDSAGRVDSAIGRDSAGRVVSAGGVDSTDGLISAGVSLAAGLTVPAEPSSPIRDPSKGKAELKQSLDAKQVYLDSLLAQRVAEEQERETMASTAQSTQRQVELDRVALNLTNEEMVDLMNKRRKTIAEMKAKAKREKPMTLAQQKEVMRTFVKNQSSAIYTTDWTWKDVRGLTDDQLQIETISISAGATIAAGDPIPTVTSVSAASSVLAGTPIAAGDPIPTVTSVSAASSVLAGTPIAAGVSTTVGASRSASDASVPIIKLLDSPPKDTSLPLDLKTKEQDVPLRKSSRNKSIARRRTLPSPSKSESSALPFDEDDPEAEFKKYLRQVSDDDEPVEPVSLALVSNICTWEIIPTEFGLGEIHVITRADGTVKRFFTLRELMYWASRADLMALYGMVLDKYKIERATGICLGLWSDLRTLITAREDRDASIIWDDQDQWEIQS